MALILTNGLGVSGGVTDSVSPQVTLVTPSTGSSITQLDTISFRISDDNSLFTRILIVARFSGSGIWEVVHDGDNFGPKYQNVNNTASLSGPSLDQHDYVLLRDGGWIESPTLSIYAIDISGNEST